MQLAPTLIDAHPDKRIPPANLIVLNRNGEMLFRDLLTAADCGLRLLEERGGAKSDTQ
jgi:hypothetical protein